MLAGFFHALHAGVGDGPSPPSPEDAFPNRNSSPYSLARTFISLHPFLLPLPLPTTSANPPIRYHNLTRVKYGSQLNTNRHSSGSGRGDPGSPPASASASTSRTSTISTFPAPSCNRTSPSLPARTPHAGRHPTHGSGRPPGDLGTRISPAGGSPLPPAVGRMTSQTPHSSSPIPRAG
ncbi:hypothetical protein GWK47_031720 [Chionoecetes opilio]|uniref:Uncharacterized protein n=1 Tax=Chionoecetes opilio TaxID=41210 RepID=A0A8J4YIQ4_CHIOP|nr:hypothetical protein GWK47_031720 [Chionoecetes opilio]